MELDRLDAHLFLYTVDFETGVQTLALGEREDWAFTIHSELPSDCETYVFVTPWWEMYYGGIIKCVLDECLLTIHLDEDAADFLNSKGFEIFLFLSKNERDALAKALTNIFNVSKARPEFINNL